MRGSVTNAGLWFDDAECLATFSTASEIREDRMDAFALCLAKLELRDSARSDTIQDAAVLTYPPGFEIEARILDEADGPHLTWIGYVSRRDRPDGLPSVSPDILEALRVAGTPSGALQPDVAAQLGDAFAWLDVCIDAAGTVTETHPRYCSSRKAGRAFIEAAKQWKFRPYTIRGQAMPVCSLVTLSNPPNGDQTGELPPPDSERSADDPILVPSRMLERIHGDIEIPPDDYTKELLREYRVHRLRGMVKVCIDQKGHVSKAKIVRSTGLTSYDRLLEKGVSSWVYAPYAEDGQPLPVCTGIVFTYSQS